MEYEVCVDIGGTFTDAYLRSNDGTEVSVKVPSTPNTPADGFFDALEQTAAELGLDDDTLMGRTNRLIHGTTIATNAIIEGSVAKTALLCTEGFRDTLALREGGKADPYEWDIEYPEPYVPRSLTFGVPERITAEGTIETPLDEDAVLEVIETVKDRDVEAVGVSLLWSQLNPVHEEQVVELFEEHAPDITVSMSAEVCPIIREYRRASATAINASLGDLVNEYLTELEHRLEARGFGGEALVMTANGGVMHIPEITAIPIWLVDAGPTMFPVAASTITEDVLGRNDVIALDMGGTSLDMGVVQDGTIPRSRESTVEGDHMLGIEKIDITSIGSGGGSIARVDPGGLIHVGPESAGAEPGPACFGRGGTHPTVTDATLVLGYLRDGAVLGEEVTLDRSRAVSAIEEEVSDPLGVSTIEAAEAVVAAANQTITNGIREITLDVGIDPRDFVLSGGGGALGCHVVEVARALQIPSIVLPRNAGVVSAVGGLSSPIRRDFSESYVTTSKSFDTNGVADVIESLRTRATAFFDRADILQEDRSMRIVTEARYPNQVWELDVPLPATDSYERVGEIVDAFHAQHESTFGYAMREEPVEFLQWRIEAHSDPTTRTTPSVDTPKTDRRDPYSSRVGVFDGTEHDCPAYTQDAVPPGSMIQGPAFLDAPTTTIVLPPESTLQVSDSGQYHINPFA